LELLAETSVVFGFAGILGYLKLIDTGASAAGVSLTLIETGIICCPRGSAAVTEKVLTIAPAVCLNRRRHRHARNDNGCGYEESRDERSYSHELLLKDNVARCPVCEKQATCLETGGATGLAMGDNS
jgi:hypothetical protein